MSTTLADAYLRLRPDTRTLGPELTAGAEKAAGNAGEAAGRSFGSRMKSAALGIASGVALVGGIVAVGAKQAIDSARDLNETQSKVDVVFGKSAANVKQWAASMATDFGQSRKSALDAAATFALYGKQAGKTGKDLFNFSTDLTGLASDMASFSNTSPEEAIQAIGAAFRGESDPIEKYGVLLNESRLQQVAMEKGIIKTSVSLPKLRAANIAVEVAQRAYNAAVKEHGKNSLEARKASAQLGVAQERVKTMTEGTTKPLTSQQRVLAVQAALYDQLGKKGSGTMGDFERTSAGLANQQRILAAQTENLKAKIGSALLPIVTSLVTTLTSRLMPALEDIWDKHGPQITAWLADVSSKFDGWAAQLSEVDWAQTFRDGKDAVMALGPALKDAKAEVPNLSDTLNVAGVVMKFAADNADTLAKAMPYLAAGYVAVKVATLASNIAVAASPVFRLIEHAAIKKQTAAIVANTAARAAETTSTEVNTVATGANTGAENAGILARVRARVAMIAQTVASYAVRAATIAWTAVQWALNSALLANPIGLIVLLIVGLIAVVIQAYRHNETFRKIVHAVWAAIKTAIKAVGDWFVQTLWPSLRTAFNQLMTVARTLWTVYSSVWKGIWTAISLYYGFMWNKVFLPLKNVVTKTLPEAFKAGVGFIQRWWGGLQDVARRPVDFVINTVINKGIIGSLNWLASKVGISARIAPFSFGGGKSSAPRIPSGGDNADRLGDGYGAGTGDGLGLIDAIRSPARWLAGRVGLGGVLSRFGNNPLTQAITGAGRTAVGFGVTRVKALLSELFTSGGGVGTNGLQAGITGVLGSMRGAFGNVPVISGLRPGATTLSGKTSYHASGRAIDVAPVRAWAEYLRSVWGSRLRELITPWRDINMLNGRPHRYSHAIEAQHGVFGNNAHIHAAMDRGGFLVPGWNAPIYNGTGRLEPVTPPSTMDEVVAALLAILEVVSRLAPEIGREINGVGQTLRVRGRTGAWPRST